jgi:phage gp46-like protein
MRNKDYLLRFENGQAIAVEGNGNAIANRIYTALTLQKGTLISDYEYGSELHKVKKDVPTASLAAKRYCEAALDKIKELERYNVEVNAENSQLKINVEAQTNGQNLTVKV